MKLVLDAGAISRLSEENRRAAALLIQLRSAGFWPPIVPTCVLVESLTGEPKRDANTNRFLKGCNIEERLSALRAWRGAALRSQARRGSVVDAVVIASAESGGVALTQDIGDLSALAEYASDVNVERI